MSTQNAGRPIFSLHAFSLPGIAQKQMVCLAPFG